jgi:branched-chain amino acid aminotransferase
MATLDIQIAPAPAGSASVDLDPAKIEFGKTLAPNWFVADYRDGAWGKARVEPWQHISLHPSAIVLHYAQGIFEGMKAYRWANGKTALFRPLENGKRFAVSAKRMAMPPVNPEFFVEAVKALVTSVKDWIPREPGSLYIRPTMIGTEAAIGVHASHEFTFFVLGLPSGAYFKEAGSGVGSVTVYIAETTSRSAVGGTGAVKASANYAISLLTIETAKKAGCSQVLFLDSTGKREVEELGGMNVFVVEGKKLTTPPLHNTILPGITRDSVIRLALDLGYEVEEKPIQIDDAAKKIASGQITEVFACGTAAVVVGIKEFVFETGKRLVIGDGAAGEVTRNLNTELQGIQFGRLPDRHHWMETL